MTSYRNKYLEMLKAEKSKKPSGEEPSKPSKIALRSSLDNFEGFEGTQVGAFSEFSPPLVVGEPHPCDNNVTGISGPFSPPLDAEGVPCSYAPLATGGSSGAGRSTAKTMTLTGGHAGSAIHRGTAIVTSAAYLNHRRLGNDQDRKDLLPASWGRSMTGRTGASPHMDPDILPSAIKPSRWRACMVGRGILATARTSPQSG
jgi:hypothetical protein